MMNLATFLSSGVMSSVVVLILALVTFVVVFIYCLRKSNSEDERLTAAWLIRNDIRVRQIVMSLSYVCGISSKGRKRHPLLRKKIRLLLELRYLVKDYDPDISPKELQIICRELLLMSQHVKDKRLEK